MNLCDVVEEYLREHPDWREEPDGMYGKWHDLLCDHERDRTHLPTDLAAFRQITREAFTDTGSEACR